MCFTQEISIFWAILMFSVAAYEHKSWNCWHYTLGLIYYGLMEVLQAIQHSFLARADDNYSQCSNRINQQLTYVAGIHICYQPFFTALLFQGLYRRNCLKSRIESDFTLKICFVAGTWYWMSFWYAKFFGNLAPPATSECLNYNWMRSGYDDRLNFTTPNLLNQPCTYQSPNIETGHLAWVFPNYYTSYYQPSTWIHGFLFFGPHLLQINSNPIVAILAMICYVTGPMYQRWLTPDINEQPAIWCYGSVAQVCVLAVAYRIFGVPQQTQAQLEATSTTTTRRRRRRRMVYHGKWGEKPIVYYQQYDDDDDAAARERERAHHGEDDNNYHYYDNDGHEEEEETDTLLLKDCVPTISSSTTTSEEEEDEHNNEEEDEDEEQQQ